MKQVSLSDPVLQRIGRNVQRTRGERTQAEFSTLTDVGQSVLSRIENGRYPGLDIDTLVRIALGAGCAIDDLLDGCDMAMDIVRYRRAVA